MLGTQNTAEEIIKNSTEIDRRKENISNLFSANNYAGEQKSILNF